LPTIPAGGLAPEEADNARWLASTPLIDLHDPKLRLRTQALTQLCHTERERALALYGFVRRMPYTKPIKLQPHGAREVLEAGCGDAPDKAALLVALLRAAGIPARMHFHELRGDILRGLTTGLASVMRAVVEARIDGAWVGTDTYVYDGPYMAAARDRMVESGWEYGFGFHRDGNRLWNGRDPVYLNVLPPEQDPMVLRDLGVFVDEAELRACDAFTHSPLLRLAHWDALAPGINRAVRALREQAAVRPAGRSA
jgi:hypothetical protein